MAMPWERLSRMMPAIVDLSQELIERVRRARPEPGKLEQRIADLEESERRQAELTGRLAQQLVAADVEIGRLRRRASTALWLAAAGLAAGIAGLVLALVR